MRERLGIAGGGAIACGLAVLASRHGAVTVAVRSAQAAERVCEAGGRIAAKVEDADPAAITITEDLADLAGATVIVEAIAEDAGAKRRMLAALDAVATPDTLLCSTTSSLSVAGLAGATSRPDRFVGLHVFNPVPRMRLVELAFPAEAAGRTRERAIALCRDLGKEPVVVPDTPGFVVNRLLFPYLFSAVELLEESGLPAADIDTAMELGAGHPMGPLALLDFVGLDVAVAIGDAIGADVPARLRALVAEGATGRKAGRGLHAYD